MGRWTYYAPLWLGTLLAAAFYLANLGKLPPRPVATHVLSVVIGAPLLGIILQLATVGLQGAFAQVLPVPWGRSIRGRAAVIGGVLLLSAIVLGVLAVFFRFNGLGVVAMIVGSVGAASLIGAVWTYFWSVPAAVRDFDERT